MMPGKDSRTSADAPNRNDVSKSPPAHRRVAGDDEQLTSLATITVEILEKENRITQRIADGISLLSILNFDEHYAAICAKQKSTGWGSMYDGKPR